MIKVVAALIKRNDSYLIARRAPHKDHPGKWEFPGGKIMPGETPEKALERELFEEFGIRAIIGKHIMTCHHDYETFQIELMAYEVSDFRGLLKRTDHDKIAWVKREDLENYDLSEADIEIIRTLGS